MEKMFKIMSSNFARISHMSFSLLNADARWTNSKTVHHERKHSENNILWQKQEFNSMWAANNDKLKVVFFHK